ncbi:hypothetical protein Q0V21_25170 [Paenibacillus sp. 11B]|uniref:hypothetical protein n=1 Tax=unclassified Paenibacillus TaxID=185978 RepID=UPI0026562A13|nr:hypothetical protein [Paenibacillus sp. 11B]MDN8592042.1 hypothetical protein [Paenibacillus sp. 11B]
MFEKLISEGIAFEAEVDGLTGNASLSTAYEKWAADSVELLETQFKSESVLHGIDVAYKTRHINPNGKRKTIVGCLQSAKESNDRHNAFANEIWNLNK